VPRRGPWPWPLRGKQPRLNEAYHRPRQEPSKLATDGRDIENLPRVRLSRAASLVKVEVS
jgi:hypothetical protein